MGQLQRQGKPKFSLEADSYAAGSFGLCGGPRAGPPKGDEPLATVLGHCGEGSAGLQGEKTVAEGKRRDGLAGQYVNLPGRRKNGR